MNKYLDYIMRFFKLSNNAPGGGNSPGGGNNSGWDDPPETNKPRQSRHIAAKILAFFIAIGLWLYVMNEQNPPIEARYTVPLEIRNVQANYVVADYPGDVRVRVRGPRVLIAGTTHKDIASYVDMTNLSEGRHNIGVRAIIPSSLELVETTPEMVIVHLEPIITRTTPITVDFRGVLPKNVIISRVSAKLNEATVKGPKHIVDTVDNLLGTIDVTNKTASFSAEAPLTPVTRTGVLVEGLTVAPLVTPVQVDIEPNVIKKTLEIKPIFHGELPPGITLKNVSFDPASVEVRDPTGTGTVIEKLEYIYTEPINLSEINRDTNRVVKIAVPTGLTIASNSVMAHIRAGK